MGAFASLQHREYRRLWIGAILSNTGTWMQSVALSWFVLELTGSPFWVGAITFFSFIGLALAPLGGGVADRVDRRKLIVVTQSIMMLDTILLAVLVSTGRANLVAISVLTFIVGAAWGFNGPAWQAFVPSLVPRESMVNAIALNSAQFSMARVIGPATAGFLVAALGAAPVFWINAGSYVAVLIALSVVRSRPVPERASGATGLGLADGIRYAWRHPQIRPMLLSIGVLSLFGGPVSALLPVYAREVFERGAGAYGALFAAMGTGSVVGALILGRRGRVSRRAIGAALAAAGLSLAAFAVVPVFAAGLLSIGAFGLAYLFGVSATNSAIQMVVEEQYRGRVLSLFMVAFGGLFPLGSLAAGGVAEAIGPGPTTLIGAAACAAWGLGLVWRARTRPIVPESA